MGFPWKAIWKPKAPSRVAFFLWTATLGKILTADTLRKRNIILVSWCCMCKVDGETIDHLFLHCSLAYDLWSFVFSLFGVHWVMPRKVLDLLSCWQGSFRREQNLEIWAVIPHCLMGACGGKEIPGSLRTGIEVFLILDYNSCVPYLIGCQQPGCFHSIVY